MNPAAKRNYPQALEKSEIPTLIFGARTHLQHATAWIITLGNDKFVKCRAWLGAIEEAITYGHDRSESALVVAFTATGLKKLGLTDDDRAAFPTAFQSGITGPGRPAVLGDVDANEPENWRWGYVGRKNDKPECDAILILYAAHAHAVRRKNLPGQTELAIAGGKASHTIDFAARAREPFQTDDTCKTSRRGNHRITSAQGFTKEPFGFADGISQPFIRGTPRAENAKPHEISPAGAFILGYEGANTDEGAISPVLPRGRDPTAILPTTVCADGITRADLGRNGTYLVVRQLQQDVDKFKTYKRGDGLKLETIAPPGSAKQQQDWLAAKLVGRWQNGASLVRHENTPGKRPDNEFLYRAEDPVGLGCPLGAHIRRANPRDSLTSDPAISQAITARHRLLRVGRPYGPTAKPEGILFMCLNADIEMQFETVQQSWLNRADFHGLRNESDPLTGPPPKSNNASFTIPTPRGPTRLQNLPDFVTVIGGGYFFMPSRAAIRYLTKLP